jgi:hypothetical protein
VADASPLPLAGYAHAPPIKGNRADSASQPEKPLSRALRLAMLAAHPPPLDQEEDENEETCSIVICLFYCVMCNCAYAKNIKDDIP